MQVTARSKRRAQEILDYIERHPDNHNQSSWFDQHDDTDVQIKNGNICDTTMCIAGTAVLVHYGPKALVDPWSELGMDYPSAGRKVLGLDSHEASQLFYTMNNEKAKDMLAALAKGDVKEFASIYENFEEYEDE